MKKIFAFLAALSCLGNIANAQTATSDCSSITVSSNPGYNSTNNNLWGISVGYKTTSDPCTRIIVSGSVWQPRYQLQQKVGSSYVAIGTWQQGNPTFTGLSHGTYRICIENPKKDVSSCANGITCLNVSGTFIGYWGYWPSSVGSLTAYTYTNDVPVGHATASDNPIVFISQAGAQNTYDYGQTVALNTTTTQNYNLWWIAIFEYGPDGTTVTRYATSNWQSGTMPATYSLTDLWHATYPAYFQNVGGMFVYHPQGEFQQLPTSYKVQYVTKNNNCTDANDFNAQTVNTTFFVCPAGSGCRIANPDELKADIKVNAENNQLSVFNLDFSNGQQYEMDVIGMDGRKLSHFATTGETKFDIGSLTPGMYIVHITEGGKPTAIAKFVK